TALAADEPAAARSWLDAYAAQGARRDDGYWWLRAQAESTHDAAAARAALERAVALRPDPRYYARLAAWQEEAGEPQQ
ncbi:hypothetical protein, partial [Frateuria defendens]|uniref:hypothetical protein n=1 Tax=Frateuria defendens TaxID=2219559 RepID=UPI00066FBC5F